MAKPGRPKGSGRGLVLLNVRVESDVFLAFQEWRQQQMDGAGRPLTEAEAARRLIRWALEQTGNVPELAELPKGYLEGKLAGRADFRQAVEEAWNKLEGTP